MDRGAWRVTKSQTQLSDYHISSKTSKVVWSILSHLLKFSPKILSSVPLPFNTTVASCLRLSSTQYNGQLYFLTNPFGKSFSWKFLDFSSHTFTGLYFTYSNRHLAYSLFRIPVTVYWAKTFNLFHLLLMAVLILANTENAPGPPFHLPTKSDWVLVNIHFPEDALSVFPDGSVCHAQSLQQTMAVATSFAQITTL